MDTVAEPSTPSSWGLIGQDRVAASMRRAVLEGPRHAYILAGPAQSGKRTLALAFAKALNCRQPPESGAFCGHCTSCRRIDRGTFPDVIHADLDTQQRDDRGTGRNLTLTIATVRQVSSQLALRPTESRWRLAIVDDVESMQDTAQEAFLKTLEEPPGYAVVLMLTTDADLLLPTVRSRCVTLRMQGVGEAAITGGLSERGVPADRAAEIAARSGGRAGWALAAAAEPALLDRALAEEAEVVDWVRSGAYERLVRAWELADAFSRDRDSVYRTLQAVQRLWRSALYRRHDIQGSGAGAGAALEIGRSVPDLAIAGALAAIDACIADLEANVRPRLALQTMMMSWPEVGA